MNKLFHRGYFAEIFRQLKVAGIVGAGVLMANNISSFFMVLTGRSDIFNSAIPSGSMLMLPMLSYVYIMGLVLIEFIVERHLIQETIHLPTHRNKKQRAIC